MFLHLRVTGFRTLPSGHGFNDSNGFGGFGSFSFAGDATFFVF
jgi:hypothetical protein